MATPSLQLPSDVEALRRAGGPRASASRRSRSGLRSPAPSRRRRRCCSTCCSQLEPNARVFAIDTHHLFPETYELWREVERRYDTKVEVFEGPPVEDKLWETQARPVSRDREGRAAHAGARSTSTAGSPASAATSRRRAPTRRSSAGTRRTSSGRRTRSPTGATTTAGPTSASAGCRTTSCTTRATPRSATRTRRFPARAVRAAGRAPSGRSAGCTRA